MNDIIYKLVQKADRFTGVEPGGFLTEGTGCLILLSISLFAVTSCVIGAVIAALIL